MDHNSTTNSAQGSKFKTKLPYQISSKTVVVHGGNGKRVHNLSIYPCGECKKRFISMEFLKKHITVHQLHACDHCGRIFYTEPVLKRHQTIHQTQNSLVCQKCDKSFTTLKGYKHHVEVTCITKTYSCECSAEFQTSKSLTNHRRACNFLSAE